MNKAEQIDWLDCDDEMKMNAFIDNLDDESALRRFAIRNAKSVFAFLRDTRSENAVAVAEAYLNEEASAEELEQAYSDAEAACEDIEVAFMSDEDPTETEERIENAALVALWAAYPVGHTGSSSLDSARDSALHTAFYCFQIEGSKALKDQVVRFREVGLID